jgi:carbonic anhydrase/acetyltransferase-like protein (isoleucine patch superfamily)
MATILSFAGIHPRIHPSAFVAPTATVIGNVTIGEEASVWFGAVIRGDEPEHEISVGARTSIQDNCVVHVSRQGATLIGAGRHGGARRHPGKLHGGRRRADRA